MQTYPLLFEPVVLEKVWGGQRLGTLGKSISPNGKFGESWELSDLAATSSGGAGGGSVRTVIANGELRGMTLRDALRVWGKDLLGCGDSAAKAERDGFPLLVKFLDASENLSVQVHPSPAYLAANPGSGAHLKTESWYIVDAAPGAKLYIGLRPGLTKREFEAHCREGNGEKVVGDLLAIPAIPGECHTLPSGTMHALGAGVLVAEVQMPSDTTFRVYDWGRTGRELHIEASLACGTFADTAEADRVGPPPAPVSVRPGQLCARLATTAHYTIDEARPLDGDDLTIGYRCSGASTAKDGGRGGCFVLMVLAGTGTLSATDDSFAPVSLRLGQTVLVPSGISLKTVLRAEQGLRVLRVGVGG